jgi:hypothetical protein
MCEDVPDSLDYPQVMEFIRAYQSKTVCSSYSCAESSEGTIPIFITTNQLVDLILILNEERHNERPQIFIKESSTYERCASVTLAIKLLREIYQVLSHRHT